MEYRVSLPDHDWVVAAKHKLIPSVYKAIQIQPNGIGNSVAVGYSGPTYIAVRSGKHSSSTAFAHGLDFERLLEIPEFEEITKNVIDKTVKPIFIFSVDGGPDENPRFQKVINIATHHFLKNNMDALFIATNAPGRSAFNRVERMMAPLSKELAGLILPHDHFGRHLDGQGNTIDTELEKRNFEFAGRALAEVWSQVNIDGFSTFAEYIDPESSELDDEILLKKDEQWFCVHVRTSQYFTQIVKCMDTKCCMKPRSSYFSVITDRFLPPPIPLDQSSDGLKANERADRESHIFPSLFVSKTINWSDILPKSTRSFKSLPYDLYCPSVQSELLDRTCKVCNIYFASKVMLKKHFVLHKKTPAPSIQKVRPERVAARRQRELMAIIISHEESGTKDVEWFDEEDLDLNGIEIPEDDVNSRIPIITIDEHLAQPWEEEEN
jgi:hypothetical protein